MYYMIQDALAFEALLTGNIQTLQDTMHSTGVDWILWPIFLIAAWWILLARTKAVFKVFAIPTIAVSTYFVLFIAYNIMISM